LEKSRIFDIITLNYETSLFVIPAEAGIQSLSYFSQILDSAGVYPRAGGDGNDSKPYLATVPYHKTKCLVMRVSCLMIYMPSPHMIKKGDEKAEEQNICLFAATNYRNRLRRFGIKTDDRRRHMYVVGKTGMGKTTMLENMVLHDIYMGHGVGIVDPHGDFAEKIIDFIPPKRINDVIYFNPADVQHPIGFNVLEVKTEEQKHLIAAGLMSIFKKIWIDMWSSRMEYILNNTLFALLDYPGSTLLGINRLLSDKKYRKRVIGKLTDPVIKAFWQNEFASYNERYAQEAVAPIQNKIGQFLSANIIRNMVAQVKSTINIRDIMDNNKILIMNLAKGRIGEDNSRLLGGMLITKIQLAAMERVDMPEDKRKDFFLYVDEFQNFATSSFANILSEARKYRLSLIMAHQYVMQLDEAVSDAVFGNVGSMISFRVGGADAELLAKEYAPTFIEEDLVNLSKYNIFLKLMIDGVASQPFSAITLPPIRLRTESAEKVIRVSRERYAKGRAEIEEKITRWSGMDSDEEDGEGEDDGGGLNKTKVEYLDKNNKRSGKKWEAKAPLPPEPAKTISLKDLLPPPAPTRDYNKPGHGSFSAGRQALPASAPPLKDEKVESGADMLRAEQSNEFKKGTFEKKTENRQSMPGQGNWDGSEQKKKKRRRRKKKRNSEWDSKIMLGNGPQTALSSHSVSGTQPQGANPEQNKKPEPIPPDQIVKFD